MLQKIQQKVKILLGLIATVLIWMYNSPNMLSMTTINQLKC